MIEINNISKVFRTSEVETVALNHVNLDVKEGEFCCCLLYTSINFRRKASLFAGKYSIQYRFRPLWS